MPAFSGTFTRGPAVNLKAGGVPTRFDGFVPLLPHAISAPNFGLRRKEVVRRPIFSAFKGIGDGSAFASSPGAAPQSHLLPAPRD